MGSDHAAGEAMKSAEHLRRLHPMQAFGVVSGLMKRIRVSRLEQRLQPAVAFPHKHDFFHIVIPTRGRGWHEIDFERHDVAPGSLFVMKPGQVHSWSLAPSTTGYVVEFERSSLPGRLVAQRSIEALLASSTDLLALGRRDWQTLLSLCELMAVEYEQRRHDFEAVLQASLVTLLLLLAREGAKRAAAASTSEDVVSRFTAQLEAHFHERHDVEFYAERLGMTSKALTMRLTRATGRSARHLIQERVLLESKRLLAYSNLAIGSLGGEVGFEDPNYFARFFRAKTGLSPGRFRTAARSLC
jgi:AraC-like DNA-binding protein